jgi:hypothetical protein
MRGPPWVHPIFLILSVVVDPGALPQQMERMRKRIMIEDEEEQD